jgi:hypothetical protein
MDHPQRRIRNFYIYPRFQLRYVAQMLAVSAGLTGSLGFLVYRFDREAARVVGLRALDPTDETAQFLQAQYSHDARMLALALAGFGLLLCVALAAWQIVTTHKVAGPLYYISHQVRRIRDGYLGQLHPLRKGDMLHEFFETFREMHASLRRRAEEEAAAFERLAAVLDEGGPTNKVADELRSLKRQREESLR